MTAAVTKAANASTAEYFQGSIRLKRVSLDRSLRIRAEEFEGLLKTEQGFIPLVIENIESRGPLYRVFSKEGLFFDFNGLHPKYSPRKGIHGNVRFYAGREWFSQLRLEIDSLGIQEIQWLDFENLAGASGEMTGTLTFVTNYKKELGFLADIKIAEPGGLLQERFFESLRPYLPSLTPIEGKVKLEGRDMVYFKAASLNIRLLEAGTMVGLFNIQVPEYNLNLNLNLTVKLDDENGFSQLFDIMGLIRIKS